MEVGLGWGGRVLGLEDRSAGQSHGEVSGWGVLGLGTEWWK